MEGVSSIALAVQGDYVNWVDKDRQAIYRVDKLLGIIGQPQEVQKRIPQLSDLISVKQISKQVSDVAPNISSL